MKKREPLLACHEWRGHWLSVRPLLMANGQLIHLLPAAAPLRHESIHQCDEAGAMSRLQNVNHLVDDDIFEAFAWFLREIGVQPDAAPTRVAASPFRLHSLHEDPFHLYRHDRPPLRDKTRHGSLDLFSIPAGDGGMLRFVIRSRRNPRYHLAVL